MGVFRYSGNAVILKGSGGILFHGPQVGLRTARLSGQRTGECTW